MKQEMRISNNHMRVWTLVSLLTVFVNTSRTVDVLQNNNVNDKNQTGEMLKEIEHRFSDSSTANIQEMFQNNKENKEGRYGAMLTQVDQRISDIIAENVLHFGHNLGLELAALDPNGTRSEIFSPLSIMSALSLLTLGAKGKSYQELKEVLGLDSDSEIVHNPNKYHEEFGLMLSDLQHTNVNSGGVNRRPNANWRYTEIRTPPVRTSNRTKAPVEHIIKVANGLFVQDGYALNPDYSQVLQSLYETEVSELDFQSNDKKAKDYINEWVNNATFGKISHVINDDLDKSTNIILASALYFKAFWETTFFLRATTEDNFYPDGKSNAAIKVQMMPTGGVFPFYDAKKYDCRIIGLPYKGNQTTMYVIQPNNSTRQKLRELQQLLDAHKINNMIDNMERKTAVMVFPKMHFARSIHMKKILQTMNLRDIFVNGYSDLSLIGRKQELVHRSANCTDESIMAPPPSAENTSTAKFGAKADVPVSFESIYRSNPFQQNNQILDRYGEPALIFASRFGNINTSTANMTKSLDINPIEMLPTDENFSQKLMKRQVSNVSRDPVLLALLNLELNRQKVDSYKSDLYVDDILHTVDFSVDEQGTEAAAATLTYLHRSGTDVVFRGDTPFLIVIRHDPTKLPLFYGIINKPEL